MHCPRVLLLLLLLVLCSHSLVQQQQQHRASRLVQPGKLLQNGLLLPLLASAYTSYHGSGSICCSIKA